MNPVSLIRPDTFLSSERIVDHDALIRLQKRMAMYYGQSSYHGEFIKGINANWQEQIHPVQFQLCERIPAGARVLEIGCGDGSARQELIARVPNVRYVGIDLVAELWSGRSGFVASSADQLPFRSSLFDTVVAMYVIEHLVYPARFLDEAWRVLSPGGRILLIAPDFLSSPMASERIGLTYGSGRMKLAQRRYLDALLTAYDTRLRVRMIRSVRRKRLDNGAVWFPILSEPRCLRQPGFTPDCDAVYPSCPEEILNYVVRRREFGDCEIFFRDGSTFGMLITKTAG